jgi:hypothetical protein
VLLLVVLWRLHHLPCYCKDAAPPLLLVVDPQCCYCCCRNAASAADATLRAVAAEDIRTAVRAPGGVVQPGVVSEWLRSLWCFSWLPAPAAVSQQQLSYKYVQLHAVRILFTFCFKPGQGAFAARSWLTHVPHTLPLVTS